MTPKEKAADLYNKFYNTDNHPNSVLIRHLCAKEASLICIDEILRVIDNNLDGYEFNFYKQVKAEIEAM